MASRLQRILITGATGFVGRHLIAALAAAYPDTTLFAPVLDVRDAGAVSEAIRSVLPDSSIHLAAISTIAAAEADESRVWQVNLHGTLHIARAILRHVPESQLIFASSADAYGASFRSRIKLTESAPLAPLNIYSATKAAADLALGSMAERGLHVVRLRPFNHTGPDQTPQFVVPAFARQVARIAAGLQERVLQVGNLDPERDFLDVRDVCAAYVACVARRDDLEPGIILNLASGEARRISHILSDLQRLAGILVETRIDQTRKRATETPLAHGDAALAHNLLGWAPSIPWIQTLEDVLNYWRERVDTEPAGE